MQKIKELLPDKPQENITAEDVATAVTKMVGQTAPLDNGSAELFKQLVEKVLMSSNSNKL